VASTTAPVKTRSSPRHRVCREGSQKPLAMTRVTRDRHRPCRSHLLLRTQRPTMRVRGPRRLPQSSTEPERTKTGKVVPSHGNHLVHEGGGDIATGCRREGLCAHGSEPRKRRVAPLRDPLMSQRHIRRHHSIGSVKEVYGPPLESLGRMNSRDGQPVLVDCWMAG
jgi:hypothetical protein